MRHTDVSATEALRALAEDCVQCALQADTRFLPAQNHALYARPANSQSHRLIAPSVWRGNIPLRLELRPQPPVLRVLQEPFHQRWPHLRPLRAWFVTPENFRVCLRQRVHFVMWAHILRHSQLNVRPAQQANFLRDQGLLTALLVRPELSLGLIQLSALLVNRGDIRAYRGPRRQLTVCAAQMANFQRRQAHPYAPTAHLGRTRLWVVMPGATVHVTLDTLMRAPVGASQSRRTRLYVWWVHLCKHFVEDSKCTIHLVGELCATMISVSRMLGSFVGN